MLSQSLAGRQDRPLKEPPQRTGLVRRSIQKDQYFISVKLIRVFSNRKVMLLSVCFLVYAVLTTSFTTDMYLAVECKKLTFQFLKMKLLIFLLFVPKLCSPFKILECSNDIVSGGEYSSNFAETFIYSACQKMKGTLHSCNTNISRLLLSW